MLVLPRRLAGTVQSIDSLLIGSAQTGLPLAALLCYALPAPGCLRGTFRCHDIAEAQTVHDYRVGEWQ